MVYAHPGFFSHPSSFFIYLCSHFVFLPKLGTCTAILSMQLLSVLIQHSPLLPCRQCMAGCPHCAPFLLATWYLVVPSIGGLSFGGGCAAGRSALFNTHVHSWKCVDKNFSIFPKGCACFKALKFFLGRRLGASVTAPLGSTGAQLCSFLACMPLLPHLPVLCATQHLSWLQRPFCAARDAGS